MTRLFEAKPFVIAEVGSNWRTLEECLHSIQAAKDVGADAVKFQAFNHAALYGWPYPREEIPVVSWIDWDGERRDFPPVVVDEMKYALPLEWLVPLAARAKAVGIEFMCTAFSPELVAVVDPFVSVHKVASSDAAWPQMLEAVAKTGKPVLVSMGAKDTNTVVRIVNHFNYFGPKYPAIFMTCVASYPADCVELPAFSDAFPHGFSDHTLGYTATVEAARRGAIVIEKHFTAFPDLDTPDRPHSLTPAQFTRMVKLIRGEPVESEEGAMFLRHNRRLVATHDIQPGQHLKYGVNFGAYRSLVDDTRGASPFDWEKVNGRMAKGEIKRGVAISLEDVE